MAGRLKVPTGLISDVTVPLPAEQVEASSGLAIDIGSTMAKLVYRSNKEYEDGQPIKAQDGARKGSIHFAMFPRTDVPGMIKYIKENADLKRNEKGDLIVKSSGGGSAAFRKILEDELNCKLEIITEFACFSTAFLAMEKCFTSEELFIPDAPEVKTHNDAMRKQFDPIIQKLSEMAPAKDKQTTTETSSAEKEEDPPRLLVMAGSGTGIIQINSDGSFSILDLIYTSGHFMYGLASLLTGENDYDTLIALAQKGNGKTSDIWAADILGDGTAGGGDNVYEMGTGDIEVHMFPFGKGFSVRQADMKKEDLAWSACMATAMIHCQMVNSCARGSKAKHVYFAGNVFNTELMRSAISKKKYDLTMFNGKDGEYEYHFLRNGGMFGALGAFIIKEKKPE